MSARFLRVAAIVAALGTLGTVTACSSEPERTGVPGTLEVWTRSSAKAAENYKAVFARFEEETGIKVDYRPNPELATALQSAVNARDLPDVVIENDASLGNYVGQGIVRPVDRAAVDPENVVSDEYWQSASDLGGTPQGVPYSRHSLAYGIRTDWLRNLNLPVPRTREEFVEVGRAFTEQDPDGNGVDDTYGFAIPGTAQRGYAALWASPLLWSEGGGYADNIDGQYTNAITSPESRAGIEASLDIVCAQPPVVQPSLPTDDTTSIIELATAGVAGMVNAGPFHINTLNEGLGAENWAPLPPPAGSEGSVALAEGENVYLMAASVNEAEQDRLAQFLISEEGQGLGMTAGTMPSVRLPVNQNLSATEGREASADKWAEFERIDAEYGKPLPPGLDFEQAKIAAGNAFNTLFSSCDRNQVDATVTEIGTAVDDAIQKQRD